MPHIIVEYSNGLELDVTELLEHLHASIDSMHNVAMERIKTRAHRAQDYLVGHGDSEFMHIELKLMPGRTDEMKIELSGALLNAAQDHLSRFTTKTALTVEVTDLHGPSYRP